MWNRDANKISCWENQKHPLIIERNVQKHNYVTHRLTRGATQFVHLGIVDQNIFLNLYALYTPRAEDN